MPSIVCQPLGKKSFAEALELQRSLAHQVPNTRDRVAATTWILDVLENDGYLVEEAGRFRFRSGLLRRYWLSQLP